MIRPNRQTVRTAVIAAMLIAAAMLCRALGKTTTLPILPILSLIRSAIYIGLFAGWGVSVRRRIIHRQTRRYLLCIAALMVFWMTVRTVKFNFVESPAATRYLWYLYYAGLLFIPLLSLLVALSLGKPESYRLPVRARLLFIPTAALFLLVLTNDLHQLIFTFPPGAPWTDSDYGYAFLYWLVTGWEISCALIALVIMLTKCRLPRSHRVLWLPILPFAAALLYGLAYVAHIPWLKLIAGDMTVVFCLFFAAVLESCIECGLIQSNTNYDELFRITSIRAKISDSDYNILLSSVDAVPLPKDVMRRTETAPVLLPGGVRLSGAPIRGGHVMWSDDVSELLGVLEELRDTHESMEDENALLSAEYRLKAREAHIAEQDRLYNAIQRRTSRQIELLSDLTDELEAAETEAELRVLRLLVEGMTYKQMAERLGVTTDCVKAHVSSMLSKTGYTSKTKLAAVVTSKKLIVNGF